MADRASLPLVFDAPRRGKPPRHWSDLDADARRECVLSAGLPAYRADQISRQWYGRLNDDPSTWTDLPAAQRETVGAAFFPALLESVHDLSADAGMTVKTLWRLHDRALVESVLMRYPRQGADQHLRTTICVSSQAGCGMGCPFCATGQSGLQRNMSTGEIVEQVTAGARALARGKVAGGPGHINNVVFMGMGEPLANYAAVVGAVRRLIEPGPQGLGISARGITVSTVGLVPRITQLAAERIPITLALSLHAPDDELRDEIVPVNNRWKVAEAVDAASAYARATSRRVSIEYALIKDVNDQAHRADLLARVLNGRGRGWVHVNLIPLNPTPGSRWTASEARDEREFVRRLETAGIPVTVRNTRGREIDGACGQLAATGSPTRKD